MQWNIICWVGAGASVGYKTAMRRTELAALPPVGLRACDGGLSGYIWWKTHPS